MNLSLIILFVSASHNFGFKHAAVLPTGTKRKTSVSLCGKKTLQSIFFVVDLSIYFRHLIGILIGTVLKQLSDENHLDFIFIIYLFPLLKEPRL